MSEIYFFIKDSFFSFRVIVNASSTETYLGQSNIYDETFL